jgi:hypothetical protein
LPVTGEGFLGCQSPNGNLTPVTKLEPLTKTLNFIRGVGLS